MKKQKYHIISNHKIFVSLNKNWYRKPLNYYAPQYKLTSIVASVLNI